MPIYTTMMPSLTDNIRLAQTHSGHRFSADEKCCAVKRILGSEEPEDVAAEMNISLHRLRRWERTFLDAGRHALAAQHDRRRGFLRGMKHKNLMSWSALLVLLVLILGAAASLIRLGMAVEP